MLNCKLLLTTTFKKEFISFIKGLSPETDEKEIKKLYVEGLKHFRDMYKGLSDDDFFEAIQDFIKSDFEIIEATEDNKTLANVISKKYNISKWDPYLVESTIDDSSKFDKIDTTTLELNDKNAIKEQTLAKYFPMASDARLAFELKFKEGLIKAFFFNDTDGNARINISSSDMDRSIKRFRKELFKYLDSYVMNYFPREYAGYKNRIPEYKLKFFKTIIGSPMFTVNAMELIKLPVVDTLLDEDLKNKLYAYMSYIALNHFDEMVQDSFSDSILISHKGDYSETNDIKYRINLGDKNKQGWSDEGEDVDETEEIGGVIRLFLESQNLYDVDTGERLPVKMSFSDVKLGLGGLMKLFTVLSLLDKGVLMRNIRMDTYIIDFKKKLENSGIKKLYRTEEGWEKVYDEYVKGKTLGELLALAKLKPSFLMPLLFTILALNSEQIFNNRYQERLAVFSLWKNLFDMNNPLSLISRTINVGGINMDNIDLYSFAATLFVNIENIPVIEYREDNDKTSIIGLKQNTANTKLNAQKYIWEAQYNVRNMSTFKTFEVGELLEGNIVFVDIKNSDLRLKLSESGGSVISLLVRKDGGAVSAEEGRKLSPELQDFLTEALNVKIDLDYYKIYNSVGGKLDQLLNIAGTLLYNYRVGKTVYNTVLLDTSGRSKREVYDEEIQKIYKENLPKLIRGTLLPELFSTSLFPKMRRFSLALDIQQGYTEDVTAKDGSGKQLSLLGLSTLDSKYMELVYNHNKGNPNSILKDFSIYENFEGVEYMRDFAGALDKKQCTKFSETEFFIANFLYDFYSGQAAIDLSGKTSDLRGAVTPYEETKFRVMGPIISDKGNIPKLVFDWRSKVKLPNGEEKRYVDLTVDDIYDILRHEFGRYYQAVYNRINLDYNNIIPYILRIIDNKYPGFKVILDYHNDFFEFNSLCDSIGVKPEDIFHEALLLFLKEARANGWVDDSIKIIKGIHYIMGKDKKIHNNPALFHQLSIYGINVPFLVRTNKKYLPNLDVNTIRETGAAARERLNLLLISELLQTNIFLRFNKDDMASKIAKKFFLTEQSGWATRNDVIIFAKILDKNKGFRNLASLRDFLNWKEYRRLTELLIRNKGEVPAEYDVRNPKFRLDLTLKRINLMRELSVFRYTESQDILLENKYFEESYGQNRSIREIISLELEYRFPKWKPETIQRKTDEQISKMSKEEIVLKKAKFLLNLDIDKAILGDIDLLQKFDERLSSLEADLNFREESLESYLKSVADIRDTLSEELKMEVDLRSKLLEKIKAIKTRMLEASDFYSILLNPEIERYLALNNWLGEQYQLTTVGTFIAHPGDNNASTIYNYEYRNFGQQVKRNVSHTASKHREMLNSLKGIRSKLRIAIITDAEDSYITFKGDYGNDVKTLNGATFYNGTMVLLDNNSLGADAMGQDKKPFLHAIDPETGIGIIIKTAGFAITNQRIQNSILAWRINKKMNDIIKWTDSLKRFGYSEPYFDWLHDYNGNELPFVNDLDFRWYAKIGDKYYKFYLPAIDKNTGYTDIQVQEVYDNGEIVNSKPQTVRFGYVNGQFVPVVVNDESGLHQLGTSEILSNVNFSPVNSNWELWNIFGGAYSCHFGEDEKLTYINDEGSFLRVNYVMNHTGKIKDPSLPALDQTNVVLILKESQIDMMPTTEAVKFGPANINNVERILNDDDYDPTYMEVFSDDFGEQLDAEHTAEGGHVSLMTLVVNALGARGYSTSDAEECYRALELLAEQSFDDAFNKLEILNGGNSTPEDKENFKVAIANIMLQTLKNVSISDGNILSAIAQGLKRFQKFGDYSLLEGSFPISSPQIYANLFSKLASSLEKAAIRLKFEGGMLVLNPSNGIYQICNGKFLGNVSDLEIIDLQVEAINNPIKLSSEILMGHRYYVLTQNKEGNVTLSEPILVDNINDFHYIKNNLNLGSRIIEAFLEGLEYDGESGLLGLSGGFKPIGRELSTYGCTIKESTSDRTFSLWEVDVVKLLFSWNGTIFDLTKNPHVKPTLLEVLWNKYLFGSTYINDAFIKDLNSIGISPKLIEEVKAFPTVEEALLAQLLKIGIREINPELMRSYLEQGLQKVLNSISGGIRTLVVIDGESINVDPDATLVTPYEAVLPMIYKTSFGLRDGDDVGTIEKDKHFFVKRFIENSESKFYIESDSFGRVEVDGSEFDLELKRTSGQHTYIAHTKRDLSFNTEVDLLVEVVGNNLYRVQDGKRLYVIPSKKDEKTGLLIPNCRIVKSGSNNVEIILTDDITFMLNQGGYNSISFGDFTVYDEDILAEREREKLPEVELSEDREGENDDLIEDGISTEGTRNSKNYNSLSEKEKGDVDKILENIFTLIESSTNRVAQNKIKYLLRAISSKIKRTAEGLKNENSDYIKAVDPELLTLYQLVGPVTLNSVSDIFKKENESYKITLNALHAHELYFRDASNQDQHLKELASKLDDQKQLDEYLKKYSYMKGIVKYGREQHTSFLTSLEAVVSRTPAQSHQSFMAMKIVGFDSNTVNSIYVSRMQLFLQGSDFDIDKANFLGLKFINGRLVTWSPYYDLSTRERAEKSESLPFPSGEKLNLADEAEVKKIPWDVIEKDYQKIEQPNNGYAFIDNNGNIIKASTVDGGKSYVLEFIPNLEGKSLNTYILLHAIIKNFKNKTIISDGVLNEKVFNISKGGKYKGLNTLEDYKFYLESLDLSKNEYGDFNNLKDLGLLIRTFTSLETIPKGLINEELEEKRKKENPDDNKREPEQYYVNIVDRHNTVFLKRDGTRDPSKDRLKREALYNFISIKTKNISKSPANLILGLSGIDIATEDVKKLVKPGGPFDRLSSISETSDHRSVLARMKLLVLTLTGKLNVGIVASAMKVFEAISHHYYKVLANGTEEELKRLLSNITILGKKIKLIANSFTKNPDTILNQKVYDAYMDFDNTLDAFIFMSALLSLATDNAKDPTLSKLNATPQTLGCYTAGLVLGLSIEEVADLLVSDTGLLLVEMLKTNVFNLKLNRFNKLSDAIRFLRTTPELPKNVDLSDYFELFGLKVDENTKQLSNEPGNSLRTPEGRTKFKLMALFILNPELIELETDETKLAKRELKKIKDNRLYWGWTDEQQLKYELSSGKEFEKLEKEYKERLRLLELKESYEAYLDDPNSEKGRMAKLQIEALIELTKQLTSETNLKKLQELRNSNLKVKEAMQTILDWIDYMKVVENDTIEIDGKKLSRLENIRKLNSFNEEMGDLRKILKLNLGLPNSVQDLLNWINDFKGLLSRAAVRLNRTLKDDSNGPLATFNDANGGSLDLDLNRFLNDPSYLAMAIAAYESVKVGVNILDVMLDVPHYTGYMKTMNLLYEGGKVVSKNYDTQAKIAKEILPKLSLKKADLIDRFFKTLNPIIFERVNNNFLWLEQIEYEIPKFTIKNNKLIESKNEDGSVLYETIRLGTKKTNDKFKEYCVYYVYPYLKNNYPDNPFVKAITLRTYGYNLDHKISVNIAKKYSYNMTNPQSNALFNEVKKALNDLNSVPGLIKTLFYYNLVAYNNQPGSQSLTSFFEDFLIYGNNKIINKYNKYITYLDESDTEIFNFKDPEDVDYLMRMLAPKVFPTEDVKGCTYIWVTNPETNEDVLLVRKAKDESKNSTGYDEPGYDDDPGYNEEPLGGDNEFVDDNEWGDRSRYNSYKTMFDIKSKLLNNEFKEWEEQNMSTPQARKFILGRSTLSNPTIFDEILVRENSEKGWTDISITGKNKFLKNHSSDILFSIDGKLISLKDIIEIAKSNGWKESDVLSGFEFVKRKSKDHTYTSLVYGTLKSTLDLVLKPKPEENCNG